jgi:hypothetical protein
VEHDRERGLESIVPGGEVEFHVLSSTACGASVAITSTCRGEPRLERSRSSAVRSGGFIFFIVS